jgi:signal transduction histidine kinase
MPAPGIAVASGVGSDAKEERMILGGDKRHVLVMLRWVLIIALSYVLVFSSRWDTLGTGLCIALFLASNVILMRLPARAFTHPLFDPILGGVDIVGITLALWLCGSAGADFFFLFFFVIFLGSLGERPELTAIGAGLAGTAYLVFLYPGDLYEPTILLRIPFLFITALTYGYLARKAREASARAYAAEQALGAMSEEVRTPLSMIVRYSEMLRAERTADLTPAQRENLAEINRQAVDLLELIVGRLVAVVDGKDAAENGVLTGQLTPVTAPAGRGAAV